MNKSFVCNLLVSISFVFALTLSSCDDEMPVESEPVPEGKIRLSLADASQAEVIERITLHYDIPEYSETLDIGAVVKKPLYMSLYPNPFFEKGTLTFTISDNEKYFLEITSLTPSVELDYTDTLGLLPEGLHFFELNPDTIGLIQAGFYEYLLSSNDSVLGNSIFYFSPVKGSVDITKIQDLNPQQTTWLIDDSYPAVGRGMHQLSIQGTILGYVFIKESLRLEIESKDNTSYTKFIDLSTEADEYLIELP